MERTAEFRAINMSKEGKKFDFVKKTFNQSGRNSTFSREQRWREPKMYCKHTGESAFLGPGSYNEHENFNSLTKKPCTAVMKQLTLLDKEESKKQCYVMVGQQIKYEPAWASGEHKKFLNETSVSECKKSVTQSLSKMNIDKAQINIRKSRK